MTTPFLLLGVNQNRSISGSCFECAAAILYGAVIILTIISTKKAGIWTKKITDVKYPAMKWLKSERGRAENLRQEAEKKRLEMLVKALRAVFAQQEQKTA